MARLATIDLKGKEYATVPTRLKAFREENPRSSVVTKPTMSEGVIMFEATIIKDQADEHSARATGHSYGKLTGEKAFEKQETIAVGRALSLLGYLNDGQVASSEEMEAFEQARAEKREQERRQNLVIATQALKAAKTMEQLRDTFVALPSDVRTELEELKNELKAKLEG